MFRKKENIIVFWKRNKTKVGNKDAFNQAEIDMPQKITLQPEFFL